MVSSEVNFANVRIVKGAVSGIYTKDAITDEETAQVDLQIILETKILLGSGHLKRVPGHLPHLAIFAQTAEHPNWGDVSSSFEKTTLVLKQTRLLRMLSRGNIFPAIRIAYMGILWRDLSIDLVAASLRQREFLK